MPGNVDTLRYQQRFDSANEWGVPDLAPYVGALPTRLTPINSRRAIEHPQPGDMLHCFLDDHRFETVWSRATQGLTRVARVGASLTPDFSLWPDMPPAMQVWQTYRSRWVGVYWQAHGIDVVPSVTWSTPASHAYAFAGLPSAAPVAISTVGLHHDRRGWGMFRAGMDALQERCSPACILVYGSAGQLLNGWDGAPLHFYPSRWHGGVR